MALVIGIENGIDKGISEKTLKLTNGFNFGVVCMHAGVSRIGDKGYRVTVSPEEAAARFKLVLDTMPLWDDQENTWEYKWLTNPAKMEFLEEHDWTCNAGSKSTEEFLHHMSNIIMGNAIKDTVLNKSFKRTDYSDIEKQMDTVRQLIGAIMSGEYEDYYDDNMWMVDMLTDAFEPYDNWDLNEPFYNGKYLVWDDDDYCYRLETEPQKEE